MEPGSKILIGIIHGSLFIDDVHLHAYAQKFNGWKQADRRFTIDIYEEGF